MPTFLAPHKSGVHRVAAIALYRALLSQSKKVPFEQEKVHQVRDIVRSRFKDARYVTSTRQLKVLFTAGYEGIDLLDGAVVGQEAQRKRLGELLERAPPVSVEDGVKEVAKTRREEKAAAPRNKIDMFSRPLPKEKLSGKRRIPVLVNANHIPVLRFTKPQPASLSGYLHSRIVQRQKRQDRRHALEDALRLAREEDRWDSIVYATSEGEVNMREGDGEVRWAGSAKEALEDVQRALLREKESNRVWAERLQGIVDRETEMAEREREEERSEKMRAREDVYWREAEESTMPAQT